jgi:phage-related protein
MAANEVGTAYVKIKAVTAALGKDISDAVDKGVADAKGDIAKSGEKSGDAYNEGAGKSLNGPDGVGKQVTNAWDPPDASKRIGGAGEEHTKAYSEGVDKETKRRNPFQALRDAFSRNSEDMRTDVDRDSGLNEAFAAKGAKLGESLVDGTRKGVDKETKKKSPFEKLESAFEKTIGRFKVPAIAWKVLLAPQALRAIAPVISGALAGITAALGFLVEAALGAGVALGGVAAVAIPALGVLLAAFKVQSEEMDNFKKSAGELLKPFKDIAVATQKAMFPGLLDALEQLQILIKPLAEFGKIIGTTVGNFARFAGQILTSDRALTSLETILSNSGKFFDTMSRAALTMLDAALPLFAAMAPLANQLADSLLAMTVSLNEFVQADTGGLAATFQSWYDKLVVVGNIVADVFIGLWNILKIAGDSDLGTGMFAGLADAAARFRLWTESLGGENALKKWFQDAQPFLQEVWGLLTDIFKMTLNPIFTGDFGGATATVKRIREDWLPVFQGLADALSNRGVGDALLKLADAFVGLLDATAGSGTLVTVMEALATAIDLMAIAMGNPIVQQIATTLLQIVLAIAALNLVLSPAVKMAAGIAKLGEAFSTLSTALASPVAVPLLLIAAAVGALFLTVKYWDQINAALASAWEWFTKLNTPLKITVGLLAVFVASVMGPLVGVAAVIYGIAFVIKNWAEVLDVLAQTWDRVKTFFTEFPDMVSNLPATLAAALSGIGDSLQSFIEGLPDMLSGLADSLKSVGTDLWEGLKAGILEGLRNLPNLILDGLSGLGSIGGTIIGLLAEGIQRGLPLLVQGLATLPGLVYKVGVEIFKLLVEGLVRGMPLLIKFLVTLPFKILGFAIDMGFALVEGFIRAWPRILQFLKDLPGYILKGTAGAAKWLLETGKLVLQGLVAGLKSSIPMILDAFLSLIPFMWRMGGLLIKGMWDGVKEAWAAFDEAMRGLPGLIVDAFAALPGLLWSALSALPGIVGGALLAVLKAVGDWILLMIALFVGIPILLAQGLAALPGLLWDAINAGLTFVKDNIGTWIDAVVTFFRELPGKAKDAIGALGTTIWSHIASGFATAKANISKWIDDVVAFFTGLPGKIKAGIGSLGNTIWDHISSGFATAKSNVSGWIDDVVQFFKDLPGKIKTALGDLGTKIWDNIKGGFATALSNVKGWVSDVITEIKSLPDKIKSALSGAVSGLTGGVTTLLKNAWNAAVDKLPALSVNGPFGVGKISFDPWNSLKLALGGIIPGTALGTPALVGEGGKSEAVVPMERPGRALSIMQAAGLDKLVLDAYLHGKVPGKPVAAGPTTMLAIDKAVFQAPVDADMVVQKIVTAYRRMAS